MIQRPYLVQGGFRSWVEEGLRIKELKPETTWTILNEVSKMFLDFLNVSPMIAEGPKAVPTSLLKCQKMKDLFIEKVNYYDLYISEVTPMSMLIIMTSQLLFRTPKVGIRYNQIFNIMNFLLFLSNQAYQNKWMIVQYFSSPQYFTNYIQNKEIVG